MTESSHRRLELVSTLRVEGPLSPADLMRRLRLSQPTLFRAAKAQPETIIALGSRRDRKIAALRNVRKMGTSIPIFLISPEGEVTSIGGIHALYPSSFVHLHASPLSKFKIYPGLPFFVDDLRPQGFLGRAFGQKHADLRLPQRILDWNSDDILEALARRGEDLVGNILVGAESFERYQTLVNTRIAPVSASNAEEHYVARAQAAIDGEIIGSSAGGEQPKFGAVLSHGKGGVKKVLVKFSPAGKTFAAQRWRDLLVCESLSLEILNDHGIAAAEGRIIEAGGRTFLETVRFDRAGHRGRKGIISLSALENEWAGHGENWAVSASLLERGEKISSKDLKTIQTLECFGRLIANSDRHSGNLSFFWQPGEEQAVLAPVYDMLPMLYAPSSGGEDTNKNFTLPLHDHTLLEAWKTALPLAVKYWERVTKDMRISAAFREIAGRNLRVMR